MALLLREDDVRTLLPMSDAIAITRDALRSTRPDNDNLPRRRLRLRDGVLNVMAASVPHLGAAGLKAYAAAGGSLSFVALLWDVETGRLQAILEADGLGRLRTGAATGVATDLLAIPRASTLGLIGSGRQAETQLEAVAAIRPLRSIRVFSRGPESRNDFARRMSSRLGIDVVPVETAEEAVRGMEIVVTVTTAREPVIQGAWLEEGAHVNAAGSNRADRREVDTDTVTRASVVAVDSITQAHQEAGDLIQPVHRGVLEWDRVLELGTLLRGEESGREDEQQLTLYKSLGIAVEDVAAARFVYQRAVEQGVGEETTFGAPLG